MILPARERHPMQRQWSIWKALALLLPASLLIAVYVYIGQFNRLMGDDYCLLYYAIRLGVFRSIWYWYLTWHGAYATSFADFLLVYFGESGMGLVTPVVFTFWLFGVAFSITMLLSDDVKGFSRVFSALALGAALIVLTLVWSPALPQSLFWWSGVRGYIFPLVVASYYPGLYLKFIKKERTSRQVCAWSLLSFCVLFLAGGFSELFSPEQLAFLLFFIALGLATRTLQPKGQSFIFLLAGLSGAFVSLMVMATAPGNMIRQGNFPPPPDVLTLLEIAYTGYKMFLGYVLTSSPGLAALAATLLGAIGMGIEAGSKEKPRLWSILATLFAGVAVPFSCFLLFAYAMSEPVVARAAINPVYFLSASILYAGFLVGKRLAAKMSLAWSWVINPALVLVTFALMAYVFWINGSTLYSLRQAPISYAENWDRSHAAILQAKQEGAQVVYIPAVQNWAGVFEPNDNPRFYVNKCMSNYYGIQVLAVEPPE